MGKSISKSTTKTVQAIVGKIIASEKNEYSHFENVIIGYWFTNGHKHYPSISRPGDLFIFDDFILVVRKQKFLTFGWLIPLIISFEDLKKHQPNTIESAVAKKFIYRDQQRKDVQIELRFVKFAHHAAVLSLKHLTDQQIAQLRDFEQRHTSTSSKTIS